MPSSVHYTWPVLSACVLTLSSMGLQFAGADIMMTIIVFILGRIFYRLVTCKDQLGWCMPQILKVVFVKKLQN